MTSPIRALCAELVEKLDDLNCNHNIPSQSALVARARVALSAPTRAEGVGELALELCKMAEAAADGGYSSDAHFLSRAAAVIQNQQAEVKQLKASALAQPAPPAEGEVGELVEALRADAECAEVEHYDLCNMTADQMRRAADLLAQRHPAPMPVGERLQQMEDLAADAVRGLRYIEQSYGLLYGVGWDRVYEKADRLLPSHALPLPAGEVQP